LLHKILSIFILKCLSVVVVVFLVFLVVILTLSFVSVLFQPEIHSKDECKQVNHF
jgi:hypothetical protein